MLPSRQLKPKILIAHPWMGRGGSEATAMWSLHALQDLAEVTFTTASPMNLAALNAIYGTSVSPEKVSLLPAPGLPGVRSGTRLVHWQRARFDRFCRRIAGDYDACISAYNPIDFGRPAIQLIGDFSFSERARLLLYPNAEDRICHRQSLLRRIYLTVGECLRGWRHLPLAERGDCAVANSRWTAERLERIVGLNACPVLYPPSHQLTDAPPESGEPRDPLGFVCLGRISPEKEIETLIAILDRVRSAGHPVTLDLVGAFGSDDYSRRIRRLAGDRSSWIRTPGFLDPAEKARLFASRTYALHACRVEAFGIAVAEMAAAGLIPVVPRSGGAGEIVAIDELTYGGIEEGAYRIVDLLENPGRHASLRHHLREQGRQFRPEAFVDGLVGIVGTFLGSNVPPSTPARSPHVV